MNFKYVPVFRYRAQERKALNSTLISEKILPLIEVVTEKPTSNSKSDSIQQLINDINESNTRVMLDFPMYLKLRNATIKTVRDFLTPILADPLKRVKFLSDARLVNNKDKIIPVITYNPNSPFVNGYMNSQEQYLRQYYDQVSFRLYPLHFRQAITEIKSIIKKNDIILLDIDESSHELPDNRKLYNQVQDLANSKLCKSVLIRSAIPRTLTNVNLNQGKIVQEADNSLLKDFNDLGFSAFGDYCGVKKDELKKGGMVSPGYVMYSWNDNSYFGFKGVRDQAETFEKIVVPNVTSSNVWNEFNRNHRTNCLGCKNIINIRKKIKKGNSQPEWKGFACGHYLHTMEEFL
ncbi:beta family protein [Cytobacillus sp.]|uniref:beta family protein n=1 Tax=Cytobacillus sp. TaxID=2675269 RepID=UPI0028BE97BF|nr:hypothetical protein [Cytobacillus sp.]